VNWILRGTKSGEVIHRTYPHFRLHDLKRISDDCGNGLGNGTNEKVSECPSPDSPLETFVNHEHDCRIEDQE